MTIRRPWFSWMPAAFAAGALAASAWLALPARADEELTIQDEAPAAAAPAAAPAEEPAAVAPAAPAAKPKAGKARGRVAVILRIVVEPVDGKTEIRVEGKGNLAGRITKADGDRKLILDFDRALYQAPRIALGAPGIGDVKLVRGAQFKPLPAPVARVVIELNAPIQFTESRKPGRFILTMATAGVAGPDEEASAKTPAAGGLAGTPASGTTADQAAAQGAEPAESDVAGPRASLLHAMTTDLPDRVRLVVTADGVLRYKLASVNDGRELQLSMAGVDLKWNPPKLVLKDGPIEEVRAAQVQKPVPQVRMIIRLRSPRPYHVRRDQNQVIIEVEKPAEGEAVNESASRGGDLLHRVTLNVHNEDLTSLVKALAFEGGFDNVVINRSVSAATEAITISLRDIQLAKALNLILAPKSFIWKVERGVLRVGSQAEFDAELETTALSGGGSGGASEGKGEEEGIVTRVFRMKFISVFDLAGSGVESGLTLTQGPLAGVPAVVKSDLVATLTSVLVSRAKGKVMVDGRSNSLIVTDAASNMAKIARLIRDLDVQVPQVHIEARLIQIKRDRLDEIGINWLGERSTPANPSAEGSAQGFATSRSQVFDLRTALLGPGFNLDATLQVMQERGDGQIILNPSITTLHDRAAIVATSESRQYRQITSITTGNVTNTTDTVAFVDIPTTLSVRPHVNPDGTVLLEVDVTMTNPTDENSPPNTIRQEAGTRLLVRNHQTGVIGGLRTDRKSKTVRKVPILGDLPWFLGGALFRTTQETVDKLETVLFLTPTIAEEI